MVDYKKINLETVYEMPIYHFVSSNSLFIVFFKNIDSCQIGNKNKLLNFKIVVFHNSFRGTVLE